MKRAELVGKMTGARGKVNRASEKVPRAREEAEAYGKLTGTREGGGACEKYQWLD